MWVESVNSTIFFWHAQKLRQGVYLRDFSIVIYRKFSSNFPVLFLAFFIWSVNFSSHFFSPILLVSKLYELISEMSRNLNMNLYLRTFSIATYQKFDLYYLCLFRLFSGLQIVQSSSVNYDSCFRPSWIYGQCWYLVVFFWSVNCANQVCISSRILNIGNVLFEVFQYLGS